MTADQVTVRLDDGANPLHKIRRASEMDKLIEEENLDNGEDYGLDVNHKTKSRFIVSVHHPYREYWDIVIILSLVFTATVTPFEVAFLPAVISGLFVVNRFVDFIFLTDMGLTLMTPILDEEKGVWIFSHWGIFIKYARFWFWIDLLTIIPFDAISIVIEMQNGGGGGNLQGIRLLRLLRLIKLARIVRASRILKRRESELEWKYSTLTVIKFLVIILMLMHWVSCIFALIPELDGQSYDSLTDAQIANGTNPFSWIVVYFDGLNLGYGEYNIWSVYLAGCYFAAMTLTTIGYGDVTPKTDAERGVVCLIMLLGATFYAYAVGNICSIVQNMDKVKIAFRQECDAFANFLDVQRLPLDMKRRLKKFVHFTWTKRKAVYHRELLNNLSDSLQREIAYELSRKWVALIPFLNEAVTPPASGEYDNLVQDISLKLQPEAYPAQETLIEKGNVVDRLFIVERGTAFSHKNDLRDTKLRRPSLNEFDSDLKVATSFGSEFIVDNFVSPVFVSCATDVDVLVLEKADFFEVLEKYPVTKANIHYLSSRKNWEQFKHRVEGGTLQAFDPEDGEKEKVEKIIELNHDIKELSELLDDLEESLAVKTELLKVVRGDGL